MQRMSFLLPINASLRTLPVERGLASKTSDSQRFGVDFFLQLSGWFLRPSWGISHYFPGFSTKKTVKMLLWVTQQQKDQPKSTKPQVLWRSGITLCSWYDFWACTNVFQQNAHHSTLTKKAFLWKLTFSLNSLRRTKNAEDGTNKIQCYCMPQQALVCRSQLSSADDSLGTPPSFPIFNPSRNPYQNKAVGYQIHEVRRINDTATVLLTLFLFCGVQFSSPVKQASESRQSRITVS